MIMFFLSCISLVWILGWEGGMGRIVICDTIFDRFYDSVPTN